MLPAKRRCNAQTERHENAELVEHVAGAISDNSFSHLSWGGLKLKSAAWCDARMVGAPNLHSTVSKISEHRLANPGRSRPVVAILGPGSPPEIS